MRSSNREKIIAFLLNQPPVRSPEQEEGARLLLELFADETDNRLNSELLRNLIQQNSRVTRRLKESEERYKSVVSAMAEGVVVQDRQGSIITHNRSAEVILGLSADQLEGRTSYDPGWMAIKEDQAPFPGDQHPAMITLKTGKPLRNVIMGVRKPEGALSWISINSQPLFQPLESVPYAVVTTFTDITDRKEHERELTRISVTDHLTGIYNRLKVSQIMRDEIVRARRYGVKLSLIIFDIDHFKGFNDTYGHDRGDFVLTETVQTVLPLIRESDIMARWGGEEFLILLPETEGEAAFNLAERLRKAVAAHGYAETGAVTCSFGTAEYRRNEEEDAWIKRGDEALYQAKRGGRNKTCRGDP